MSTLKTINVQHPSSASSNIVLDNSGNATVANNAIVEGDLKFDSGYGSAATAYGCRAWVNFNGTSTVAIRASGNVTSITDNGTGNYAVNLTTAMPDANYACSISTEQAGGSNAKNDAATPNTSSAITVGTANSGTVIDRSTIQVAIFR